eukprot:Ihof_evm1s1184 gene=Ihof_evmTU1s1184
MSKKAYTSPDTIITTVPEPVTTSKPCVLTDLQNQALLNTPSEYTDNDLCDKCRQQGLKAKLPQGKLRDGLFLWAAREGHAHFCYDLLTNRNCNGTFTVEMTNHEGLTALDLAVRKGHMQVIRFLVEHAGADIQAMSLDKDERLCALHLAVCAGNLEVVSYLVEKGADINARDIHGYTPVIFAAKFGHVLVLHYLIQSGCDLYLEDEDGATALAWAADKGQGQSVRYLVEVCKMNINLVDREGMTALHWAAFKNRIEVVQILLSLEADTELCDATQMRPIDYARQRSLHQVVNLLETNGVCPSKQKLKLRFDYVDKLRQWPAYIAPILLVPGIFYSLHTLPWFLAIPCTALIMALLSLIALPSQTVYLIGKGRNGNILNPTQANMLLVFVLMNFIVWRNYLSEVTNDVFPSLTTWFPRLFIIVLGLYFYCRNATPDQLPVALASERLAGVNVRDG